QHESHATYAKVLTVVALGHQGLDRLLYPMHVLAVMSQRHRLSRRAVLDAFVTNRSRRRRRGKIVLSKLDRVDSSRTYRPCGRVGPGASSPAFMAFAHKSIERTSRRSVSSQRTRLLMQLAPSHQASGDVGRLQRSALGRGMSRQIAGNRNEDLP